MTAEVFIVEDHNEALWWIYRGIGAKRLPRGSVLLHLDSHPDLQLPAALSPAAAEDPRGLHDRLSIGDWILPAVFCGHLSSVVWLRPAWAHQLVGTDCVLQCQVGVDRQDHVLRVDSALPYFLSESMTTPTHRLERARPFSVHVLTLHEQSDVTVLAEEVRAAVGARNWVLDVDLDFFSTKNPFADILPEISLPVSSQSSVNLEFSAIGVSSAPPEYAAVPGTGSAVAPGTGSEDRGTSVYGRLVGIMAAVDENTADLCRHDVLSAILFRRRMMTLVRRAFRLSPVDVEGGHENYREEEKSSSNISTDLEREHESYREEKSSSYIPADQEKEHDIHTEEESSGSNIPTDQEKEHEIYTEEEKSSSNEPALLEKERDDGRVPGEFAGGCADHDAEDRLPNTCRCVCDTERRVCWELRRLVNDIDVRLEGQVDWLQLFYAACTADEGGLPHHVSSSGQIACLMNMVQALLGRLGLPGLVTIARSSLDNYCPPDQVDDIQRHLLEVLQTIYGKVNIHLKY